jgi:hypothetical protein
MKELPIVDAPGDFYVVADDCICCEAPVPEAEGLLAMGVDETCSERCYVKRQPTTDDEVEKMIDAMSVSCVRALRYRGNCPRVLARLKTRGQAHQADVLHQRQASVTSAPVRVRPRWSIRFAWLVFLAGTVVSYFLTAPWLPRDEAMQLWFCMTVGIGAIAYLQATWRK